MALPLQHGGCYDHEVTRHGSGADTGVESVGNEIGPLAVRNHDQEIEIAVAADFPLDGRTEKDNAQRMHQRDNMVHNLSDAPLKGSLIHGGNVARGARKAKTLSDKR